MTYQLPQSLVALRSKLVSLGADVTAFKSERQAAFMAQQLLGTRLKFPPKGTSCFTLLQRMEKAAADAASTSGKSSARSNRTSLVTSSKTKRGKVSRPKPPRPVATSATDFDTGLVVFCDGGCEPNPGFGGWSFVVYRDDVEIHAQHGGAAGTTNNVMEITAALMALRWFVERRIVEPARLICDSQYVVKGCNDWRHGWKKKGWRRGVEKELANVDLWRELDVALTLVPITLEWVRGHNGTAGNERADELAAIGRDGVLEQVLDVERDRASLGYASRIQDEIEREREAG
ncbi:hypothetical protein GTW51_18975 [Aurantimonas aggregata]|uniref:ribonuclease H n=1 Tax=Aurantimonas aggregata TaxID=2047720 RepID=A0A6L9MM58_9HYPH|nr:ribonuclease H [Aurantimonas aggregata]NDV88782.1 hypothetical protein [Aurantimonas aggregata]